MLGKVGFFIPRLVIEQSRDVIKPKTLIAHPAYMNYFENVYARDKAHRTVSTLEVEGEPDQRVLKAHKLDLPSRLAIKKDAATKMAVVYMPGNCFYVAESLPNREALLKMLINEAEKIEANVEFSLFCQDYRGRGFNQENPTENFNDYPILQDAIDQAALIKKLVEQEGYLPENILLLTHSYGSAVGLWALYLLVKENIKYSHIKNYSDRGYGNLLDFPLVNFFLSDQMEAHQLLHTLQMMPDMFLHEIASQLPETFVTNTKGEEMVNMNIGLIQRLRQEEMPGRVWLLDAKNPYNVNPHLAEHFHIKPENTPEVIAPYFMLAMLLESPIQFAFPCPPLIDVSGQLIEGYALKEGATSKQKDYVALAPFPLKQEGNPSLAISIEVHTVAQLINRLHVYCEERAKEARESGYGEEHKRGWLGKTSLFGWTAKEQIESAVHIMQCLAKEGGPDIAALQALQEKMGAYETGRLNVILLDVMKFINEYQQLLYFNQWVATMPERRSNRKELAETSLISFEDLFAPDPSIGKWTFLDSPSEEAEEEWETISTLKP